MRRNTERVQKVCVKEKSMQSLLIGIMIGAAVGFMLCAVLAGNRGE